MIKDSELDSIIAELDSKFTEDDKINRWLICKESLRGKSSLSIRRAILLSSKKRVIQRLPIQIYKNLDDAARKALVTRLNYSMDRDQRFRVRFKANSAFLPDEYLEAFFEQLKMDIPSDGAAKHNYYCLDKHVLAFFLQRSQDPKDWKIDHEVEWGKYLLDLKLSPRSIRRIIQIANRFMKFLNNKRPKEFPFIILQPISKARFKFYAANWEENEKVMFRHFIPESDYRIILKKMPDNLKSIFILCYKFGLRRSEALGLYQNVGAVRESYLLISRQLKSYSSIKNEATYGRTKNRKERKVNYWFSSPKEAYELIKNIHPMSPDTATKSFDLLMRELELDYVLHDCRHTFITNSVNRTDLSLGDVMAAVGHSDLRVTSGYMKDSRGFSDDLWTPDKAS